MVSNVGSKCCVDADLLYNTFCNLTVEPINVYFANAVLPEVDAAFEIDA